MATSYNITLQCTWTAIQTAILTVSMLLLSSMPLSAQTDSTATLATSNQNVRSTAADRHIKIGQHTYRIPLDLLHTRLEGTNLTFLELDFPLGYIDLGPGPKPAPDQPWVMHSITVYLTSDNPWVSALVGMNRGVDVFGPYTLEQTTYPGIQIINYQKRDDIHLLYYGQSGNDAVEISCDNWKMDRPMTSECNYNFSFEDLVVSVYFGKDYLPEWRHVHEGIVQRLKALQEN